jgi:formylglycine-generating enzyme required for sulfatase activity
MVPDEELLSKPIKLRNAVIFYLGHIPTFLDIHLTRATDGKPTEPASYTKIFERGIDPDVENPEQCHDHSEIPETWPPRKDVLAFQDAVRERTTALYNSNAAHDNPRVSRALWLAFEHEAMHLETLLYMLVQSERILPPPGSVLPSFDALARKSKKARVENQWFTIPEAEIRVGLEDPEDGAATKRFFGWDNEKPPRSLRVKSFKAKARPITNGEYAEYLVHTGKSVIPASWCEATDTAAKVAVNGGSGQNGVNGTNGANGNGVNHNIDKITKGRYVRTVFGTVPLHFALDWPVVASYDELASCAQWMGGRIPTMEEARSIYSYVEHSKAQEFEKTHGNRIPAVNGYVQICSLFGLPLTV